VDLEHALPNFGIILPQNPDFEKIWAGLTNDLEELKFNQKTRTP